MNMLNCPAPYGHLNLDVQSQAKACCFYDPYDLNRDIGEFETLEEMLHWFDSRLSKPDVMKNTCQKCIKYKEVGVRSQLDLLKEHWMLGAKLEHKIVSVEVALDNTCNMACGMCTTVHSSKWESLKKTNDYFGEIFRGRTSDKDHYSKVERLFLNSDLSNLQYVRFLGGEPLYNKKFETFLDILIERANPKNIELNLSTNCSIFPNERLLSKILKFKYFSCTLSIDGVEEVAELQRFGTDWSVVKQNIDSYCDLKRSNPNTTNFGISATYTILNLEHHKRLYNFWKPRSEYISFGLGLAHNKDLTIEMLESKYRAKYDHFWFRPTKKYSYTKNYFKNWKQIETDYKSVFTFLENYAKITKMDVKSIIPKTYRQLERQSNVQV